MNVTNQLKKILLLIKKAWQKIACCFILFGETCYQFYKINLDSFKENSTEKIAKMSIILSYRRKGRLVFDDG